jgi:hypothetical protein
MNDNKSPDNYFAMENSTAIKGTQIDGGNLNMFDSKQTPCSNAVMTTPGFNKSP